MIVTIVFTINNNINSKYYSLASKSLIAIDIIVLYFANNLPHFLSFS